VAGGVGLASLLVILVTMFVLDGNAYSLYRGGFLAFSLLCGAIVVVVVMLPDTRVAQMLSAPWVVAVGLRSYSLYLWHWPVRVFISPSSGIDGPALFVVRSAVTIVLAELSYRLVERPFRVGAVARHSGSRAAVMYFGGITAVAVLLVSTVAAPVALPPGDLAQAAAAAQRHASSTVP